MIKIHEPMASKDAADALRALPADRKGELQDYIHRRSRFEVTQLVRQDRRNPANHAIALMSGLLADQLLWLFLPGLEFGLRVAIALTVLLGTWWLKTRPSRYRVLLTIEERLCSPGAPRLFLWVAPGEYKEWLGISFAENQSGRVRRDINSYGSRFWERVKEEYSGW